MRRYLLFFLTASLLPAVTQTERVRNPYATAVEYTLAAGDILFEQGTFGELVYVVEDGEMEVFQRTENGDEVLGSIGPGDYFGELGPMLGLPRSATARARTASTLTGYPVQDFRRRFHPRHQGVTAHS